MPRSHPVADVNYSKIRQSLASHLDQCSKYGKRFQIMRNGKPQGILVSTAEWEQMLTTLSVLTDAKMMDQLIAGEKEITKGRVHKLDEVFRGLLAED